MNQLMIIKMGFLLISITFYIISIAIAESGFVVALLLGWVVFLYDPILVIPWLSNFLYFICIPFAFFRISGFVAIPICTIAIGMALPAFFITQFHTVGISQAALDSPSIYFWFLAYIVLFISLCIPAKWSRKKETFGDTLPNKSDIP